MTTPKALLEYHEPGDGWTLQSGEAPHRVYRFRLSAEINGRLYAAQYAVTEHEITGHRYADLTMPYAEETVRKMLDQERAKHP